MNEIWKPVKGYEGLYEVSNFGNVLSLNWKNTGKQKLLFLKRHTDGYRQVQLFKHGNSRMVCVHRLVAEAFIPNPNGLPQVNHIDYDRANNRVSNLEWCDQSYNMKHSWLNKNRKQRTSWRRKNRPGMSENIIQFSKSGETVRRWESCIAIKHELGYNQTSIWECCDGKRKSAYGYLWRYATNNNSGTEAAI